MGERSRKRNARLQVIRLYGEMSELTAPECTKSCAGSRGELRCCDDHYCRVAIEHAKKRWNVELVPTDHPTLPLMGPTGCIAPPHLRPICTVHNCEINSVGVKEGDQVWTSRYFKIRKRNRQVGLDDLTGRYLTRRTKMSIPDWWTNAEKIWQEDDSGAPHTERLNAAWKRIFKVERSSEVAKESFDAGDADLVLYESGHVAQLSYHGNNEIRFFQSNFVGSAKRGAGCVCPADPATGDLISDPICKGQHSPAGMRKTVPKRLCTCACCGRAHEVWNSMTVPPRWVAFTVFHWPAGTEMGPLYLRLCETCVGEMDRGPDVEPPKGQGPSFEPPKVTLIGNMRDLLQNVCHHPPDPIDEEPK